MSVNNNPINYTEFLTGLPIPWLNQNPIGNANAAVLGYVFDYFNNQILQAIQARFPGLAPDDALKYIADERGLIQGTIESIDDFRIRLIEAWQVWALAGRPIGILLELLGQGYTDGYLIQQNGQIYSLNGTTIDFSDPEASLTVQQAEPNYLIYGSPPYFAIPIRSQSYPIPNSYFKYELPNSYGVQQNNRFILFFNTVPTIWSTNSPANIPTQSQLNTITNIINKWKPAKTLFEGMIVNHAATISNWNSICGSSICGAGSVDVYLSNVYNPITI